MHPAFTYQTPAALRRAGRRWRTPRPSALFAGAALVLAACSDEPTPLEPGAEAASTEASAAAPSTGAGAAKLAFSAAETGTYQVYTVNSDGTGLKRLTKGKGTSFDPAFSPDGQRIAFVTNRSGAYELAVMEASGRRARSLTTFGASYQDSPLQPTWSADGSRIAFSRVVNGSFEVFVMQADGSAVTQLTSAPEADVDPVFSPDGSKLAFASLRGGAYGIYVMNADGSEVTPFASCDDGCRFPSWSPDGGTIAYQTNGELHVQAVAGGQSEVLAEGLAADDGPHWSPDGSELAFIGYDAVTFNRDVFAVPAGGGERRRITTTPTSESTLSWAQ